jgi:hypothetical protein
VGEECVVWGVGMSGVRGIWVCEGIWWARSGSGVSFSSIDLVTSTQFTINQGYERSTFCPGAASFRVGFDVGYSLLNSVLSLLKL